MPVVLTCVLHFASILEIQNIFYYSVGSIPSSIGLLTKLSILLLQTNHFTGKSSLVSFQLYPFLIMRFDVWCMCLLFLSATNSVLSVYGSCLLRIHQLFDLHV